MPIFAHYRDISLFNLNQQQQQQQKRQNNHSVIIVMQKMLSKNRLSDSKESISLSSYSLRSINMRATSRIFAQLRVWCSQSLCNEQPAEREKIHLVTGGMSLKSQ